MGHLELKYSGFPGLNWHSGFKYSSVPGLSIPVFRVYVYGIPVFRVEKTTGCLRCLIKDR